MNMSALNAGRSKEIADAFASCRASFWGIAIFSATVNVLALTGSIYMLQVYDRVIPSRNLATLVGLTIIMFVLYAGYGALDMVRARITARLGLRLDRALRERVFGLVLNIPLRSREGGDGLQPVRDLDQVRTFTTSAGPGALFDLPWMPLYLGLVYMLHPWLGYLGLGGAIVLLGFAILTEVRTREPTRAATRSSAARQEMSLAGRRNAEVIQALGMGKRVSRIWSARSERFLVDQLNGSDVTSSYGATSKVLRLVLQSCILGLGAYLVIDGQATGGVMIASSILIGRALAPVEIAIANWRGFIGARQSLDRLSRMLGQAPATSPQTVLPPASQSLTVEDLTVSAPGVTKPIISAVTFNLSAGNGLGVIGPSASGKSTLARSLVGAWQPLRGQVCLDGARLDQWSNEDLGRNVGYLPQDIELFEGTIAENIARFEPEIKSEAVIAAAKAAGVHELILKLPQGYDTNIGESGTKLSAGQRQRVALARALYGDPFLVVLDEPNSNLDAEGDAALTRAINSVRTRNGIVIVIAHRPSALAGLDLLMVMADGRMQTMGPKEEVLRRAVQVASPSGPAAQVPAAALSAAR